MEAATWERKVRLEVGVESENGREKGGEGWNQERVGLLSHSVTLTIGRDG